MAYLPPTTIAGTLRRIQKGELILPAIQREYVWKPSQVVGLFDSVMRGYPIGGFLSWKVEPATVKNFRFYGFMKDFNEFNHRHNPTLDVSPGQAVVAMLDGQQRLTSLNIGLRGTYAWKKPRAWSNLLENYPVRKLYLNVLGEAEDNEAGLRYDFRFLTSEQLAAEAPDESRLWFPVDKIFELEEPYELQIALSEVELGNNKTALQITNRLWQAVHNAQSLHFYEEEEQDVERVLDIFIRVNSAGTVLSYSDLLLSIATAQWQDRDAREAIHGLVDSLNSTGQGFSFSQDTVLKSGLVLAGITDIAFKVKNFTSDNMRTLDKNWDAISDSLRVATALLGDFGLSSATLTASSVLIPIAHYIHVRGLTHSYREAVGEAGDRDKLRSWTLRSLVMPGIWGSGLDSLLRDLRQVINEHGADGFPAAELERRMAARGKSLAISTEQIDDILNLRYGAPRTFAVLALAFPHVNTRNVHHVDHIFPQAQLSKPRLRNAGFSDEAIDNLQSHRDQLPNLQLIEGGTNTSKSDSLPAQWARGLYAIKEQYEAYLDRNQIPWLPESVQEFEKFVADRREALAVRIAMALGGAAPAPSHGTEAAPPSSMSIEDELAQAELAN